MRTPVRLNNFGHEITCRFQFYLLFSDSKKSGQSDSLSRNKRGRNALSRIENDSSEESSSKRRRCTIIESVLLKEPSDFSILNEDSSKSSESLRGLFGLPEELIESIFSHLNMQDMFNLALTSRKLSQIFDASKNMSRIKLIVDFRQLKKDSTISRKYTALKLIKSGGKLDSLSVNGWKYFQKNIILKISESIKEIEMIGYGLKGGRYIDVLRHFPNLESLKLESCFTTTPDIDSPKLSMKKLRKIELSMDNMIILFEDLLTENEVLEEIVIKGVYGDEESSVDEDGNFITEIDPSINILRTLGPIVLRQKNLKLLEVADFRFFRNEIIAPTFQLTTLNLSMSEIDQDAQINLLNFINNQQELESINFAVTTTQPTESFPKIFGKVLEAPKLRNLSLVLDLDSNNGMRMREIFIEPYQINFSLLNLMIENIDSTNFNECLKIAVRRFPNVETLCLVKIYSDFINDNFLEPLNELKNLKELELWNFNLRQVALVRNPNLKKVNFNTSGNDKTSIDLLQFVKNHQKLNSFLL